MRERLELHLPEQVEGAEVRIRLANGVVKRGTFIAVEGDALIIGEPGAATPIDLIALDVAQRLSFDEGFRDEWLNYHARAEARSRLIEEGVAMPVHGDRPEGSLYESLDLGDPEAYASMGKILMRTRHAMFPDYARACLYLHAAAMQDHTSAQFLLGSMYYQGKGVEPDVKRGLRWMTRAASLGDHRAAESIQQLKLNSAQNEAAMREAKVQREQEKRAYTERLERIREKEGAQVLARRREMRSTWRGHYLYHDRDGLTYYYDLGPDGRRSKVFVSGRASRRTVR